MILDLKPREVILIELLLWEHIRSGAEFSQLSKTEVLTLKEKIQKSWTSK